MLRLNPSSENRAHLLLTFVLLTLSISLYAPLQLWVLLLVTCAAVMRFSLYMNWQKHQLSVRTLNLMAVLCAIVLAYFGWELGLLLGMLNLLVMASSLKLMLLATRRDYFQLIGVQFFLLGAALVFNQNIAFSLFYAVLCLLLLMSLAFHINPSASWLILSKRVATLCLQALPIAILMLLVLPKLGPLWQMPTAKGAHTGLSDKVTPGDIAELARSADLAFRVTFEQDVPPANKRYWRALVMEEFDGRSWQVHPYRQRITDRFWRSGLPFTPQVSGANYEYQVIAEPTQQSWLFALDTAVSQDQHLWQNHDYTLQSRIPLQSALAYRVTSYYDNQLPPALPQVDGRLNLQLPEGGNPRTQAWATELWQANPTPQAYIRAIASHMRQQGFSYTLKPQPMPVDPIDTFLFEQQAGFCSHYASTVAYLLRLNGIPARLVTGYLGGEMRTDQYMSVYQYDAHAWVEWLSEDGWQRLDPTAWVAPMRIQYGLEQAVAHEQSFLADMPLSGLRGMAFFQALRGWLDDMDYLWSRWILGFDRKNQQDLLKALLGDLSPAKLALFGLGALATIAMLLALYHIKRWLLVKRDLPNWYYQKALALLAHSGIKRTKSQGPADFCAQVEEQVPPLSAQHFTALTRCYTNLCFRPLPPQQHKQQLRQMRDLLTKLKRSLR
ncbi:transglutaminase-like domain-containing protein [Bowmanella sp. Y26]|uniref:transglutaminase TgpA family protein n=1 Tax=Bowmanella yangjiangensis TaxID=2811230 RepID=UPI001BDCD3DC|nr:DUF3488 and transglutaminase-like domain-containing protein [Bowmanella yangjiangensis]MBT1065327.1 transglutaminase-like domain-containing protein [Bowmanella yangjiangensis]